MTIPTYKLARTKDAFWVQGPLGPFLGEGGMRVRDRHPGLSYDQWASIATFNGGDSPYLRPTADAITTAKFPQYVSNYSGGGPLPYLRGFDGWGDLEDEDDEDEFGTFVREQRKGTKGKQPYIKRSKSSSSAGVEGFSESEPEAEKNGLRKSNAGWQR